MFLNSLGTFDLQIDYIGETYAKLVNSAVGPYSYNTITSETYVPGAEMVKLHTDGYYYQVITDAQGNETLGSKIYLDMVNATYLFPSDSLQNVVESADKYETTKRFLYLDDGNGGKKDYTDLMRKYLFHAQLNDGELHGLVAIDAELMTLLLKITKAYDGFGGIENSWQLMCYHYEVMAQA